MAQGIKSMSINLSRIWAFLFLCIPVIAITPVTNVTITRFGSNPSSQIILASEPSGRGTFGIIFSCTATFAFCIWTVVHPNIIPNTKWQYRVVYKATLMVIAVFLPEGLIMFAVGQFMEARQIQTEWRTEFKSDIKKDRRNDLGMTVAFFIVMGGFTVAEPTPSLQDTTPSTRRDPERYTAILTARGFKNFIKSRQIDPFSFDKRSILDKGKSSFLAKLLAGTQALWLCLQCVGRWAVNMPLTLLEVHVVIQVLATLVIIGFWWEKPLNINEPISIQLRDISKIAPRPLIDTKSTEPINVQKRSDTPGTTLGETESRGNQLQLALDTHLADQPTATPTYRGTDNPERHHANEEKESMLIQRKGMPDAVDSNLNFREIEEVKVGLKKTNTGRTKQSNFITRRPPTSVVAIVSQTCYEMLSYVNATHENTESHSERGALVYIEGLLVAVVGALHALAWHFQFPTPVEELLWQISSIAMCIIPVLVVAIVALTEYHHDFTAALWAMYLETKDISGEGAINEGGGTGENQSTIEDGGDLAHLKFYQIADYICHQRAMDGMGEPKPNKKSIRFRFYYYAHKLLINFTLVLLFAYSISVGYITVEAYISLRRPPDGVFLTPRWSTYWPHL